MALEKYEIHKQVSPHGELILNKVVNEHGFIPAFERQKSNFNEIDTGLSESFQQQRKEGRRWNHGSPSQ